MWVNNRQAFVLQKGVLQQEKVVQAGQGQGGCRGSPTALGDVSGPGRPSDPQGTVQAGNRRLPSGLDQAACPYFPLTFMFNSTEPKHLKACF